MKNQFLKECSSCYGNGTVAINNSWDEHPSWDESVICSDCDGQGQYIDKESLTERIEDVEYMIDGMLTRIRLTSDTLKDLSRGMFYELLPKYKHRLNIQARALARLESYLSNLKTK